MNIKSSFSKCNELHQIYDDNNNDRNVDREMILILYLKKNCLRHYLKATSMGFTESFCFVFFCFCCCSFGWLVLIFKW